MASDDKFLLHTIKNESDADGISYITDKIKVEANYDEDADTTVTVDTKETKGAVKLEHRTKIMKIIKQEKTLIKDEIPTKVSLPNDNQVVDDFLIVSCNLCRFQTNRKSRLTEHMQIHARKKLFVCNLCDFKTAQNGSLKKHILKLHTVEKPFACNICQYKARRRSHLKRHIKIHKKEKHLGI